MTKVGKWDLADSQLGAGGYGVVVKAVDTETKKQVAAKIIDKRKMKTTAIEKEVLLMRLLDHKYIISVLDIFEMDRSMFIFMELADKGELFGRVIQNGLLKEDEARPYFTQLMEAVLFMHKKGVAHRDLKLENVLLSSGPDGKEICKVCDFGLAHRYEVDGNHKVLKNRELLETCGSKSYAAPEVLEGRGYDGFDADVWSCGICLFAMLAGFFPLDEATGADWRFERVKLAATNGLSATRTIFGFYERKCTLSRPVVDLIDGMITVNPQRRLKDNDVVQNFWFTGEAAGDDACGEEYMYDEAPRYRGAGGGGGGYDAMEGEYAGPLYRGVPGQPPPLLCKQPAMFCAEFHLEDAVGADAEPMLVAPS